MPKQRIIFITGSTDGLGRRVAERLTTSGVHIVLHGRDVDRGQAVAASIAKGGGSASFHRADYASLSDVVALADAVTRTHAHLDALVNNAGIADFHGPRRESRDGIELNFAVNYLAPFLLTHLLKPILGVERPSRIINVAAAGQMPIDFDNVMLERNYDGRRACAQSKLANIMHAFDLARELDPARVTANALHPATFMDTGMVRATGIRPVNSVETGADAILALLMRPDLAGTSGLYFDGQQDARANPQAYDTDARRRLRTLSIGLIEKALGSSLNEIARPQNPRPQNQGSARDSG
ncbi:SDR family NAD(P)-dependent oxidoreductase [Afifella sp. YEN Y35]|uniref:SDR family NAD(P)-dependent oxidoreductase n=1 Tax=Afifella sp. YEN Y35 TaxID=3388337 RepID=UPI0039E0A198